MYMSEIDAESRHSPDQIDAQMRVADLDSARASSAAYTRIKSTLDPNVSKDMLCRMRRWV